MLRTAKIMALALIMFIVFGFVALLFQSATATPAVATQEPQPVLIAPGAYEPVPSTITVPTAEAPEPTPTDTPAIVVGDAPYTPATDDCGPDGYRIEPGTCEWDVEIGDPIYVAPDEPAEDEPGFDCRIHGNHVCGVEVEGVWYLLNFDTNTFTQR